MAKLPGEITVSIERAAHKALEDFAQRLWDEHKIRVDSVSFDWSKVDQADGGTQNFVQGVSIESKSYRSEPGDKHHRSNT